MPKQIRLWRPEWEAPFTTWAMKEARMQAWRVLPMYDREDLMQEFAVVFSRLRARYPNVIEARHFMSLFTISCRNQVHTLSNQRSKLPVAQSIEALRESGDLHEPAVEDGAAQVAALDFADPDGVVTRFIEARTEGLATCQRGANGIRETSGQMMARVTGEPNARQIIERALTQ